MPFVLLTVALNRRRQCECEMSQAKALAIYLSPHDISNYWSADAIRTILCCFRNDVGVGCIYSNYVFTAKTRTERKKIQDPVHKMSCPPLSCLENKANILLVIHVHQAHMQFLPSYNGRTAHFQHPTGVCLLFFACDFSLNVTDLFGNSGREFFGNARSLLWLLILWETLRHWGLVSACGFHPALHSPAVYGRSGF